MSCEVGHKYGSDLLLLWLCCRTAATAPIRPLAWELPYAVGVALKSQKKKKVSASKAGHLKVRLAQVRSCQLPQVGLNREQF